MTPKSSCPSDAHAVYEPKKDEISDSEYQVLWSNTMDKGKNYLKPSTYTKVEALLLCWDDNSDDLTTKAEVKRLEAVLKNDFGYHAEIFYLDNHIEQRLQVILNAVVAEFVRKHDGPNTLLMVYYAGHGRPGSYYGALELFGQISPNDKKRRVDSIVWNQAEDILRPAEADVLELFDCCYAGQIGLTRGQPRSFEFLAATKENAATAVPGEKSFTSALIWALQDLVNDRLEGRFTTVELWRKIKTFPTFPKNQDPALSNRETESTAGRIMLHPLHKRDSDVQKPLTKSEPDRTKRYTVSLHLDFHGKPSLTSIERLGLELNGVFERETLDVNRVRWGGMHLTDVFARAAQQFINLGRKSTKRPLTPQIANTSEIWVEPSSGDLPTPSPELQHPPQNQESIARDHLVVGLLGLTAEFNSNVLASTEESEQPRRKKQKRT